jgi:hypothetical protein
LIPDNEDSDVKAGRIDMSREDDAASMTKPDEVITDTETDTGYKAVPGKHYKESFSPVASDISIRI